MIAKCGKIKTHHRAHETREDCDSWSESVGPWHLEWQSLVNDLFVEVTIGSHRADVVGNTNVVVELQHSSISPDEIAERESFYGNMIWVFDATERFPCVPSGDRVFFSFSNTRHIDYCKQPVFLDCGKYLVEVESFTTTFDKLSGYGLLRDQQWFVTNYLSSVAKPGSLGKSLPMARLPADNWRGKQPWRLTDNPSKWRDPITLEEFLIPAKSVYLPMNYKWRTSTGSVWADVIADHATISNGWINSELEHMKSLLSGVPMVLHGRLRVMPSRLEHMRVEQTVATTRRWISQAANHMDAGRIPLIKPATFDSLIERAELYEVARYGQKLKPLPKPIVQQELF